MMGMMFWWPICSISALPAGGADWWLDACSSGGGTEGIHSSLSLLWSIPTGGLGQMPLLWERDPLGERVDGVC